MEKEVERKIGLVHATVGAAFGVICGFYLNGGLTFLSVLLLGFIISYPLMPLSRKIFNLSEEGFKMKDWLTKGFFFFFIVWILVWTFLYNLR
jgi:uncharacterized membrane protein YdjX (TVP38/TMEM64 family)